MPPSIRLSELRISESQRPVHAQIRGHSGRPGVRACWLVRRGPPNCGPATTRDSDAVRGEHVNGMSAARTWWRPSPADK